MSDFIPFEPIGAGSTPALGNNSFTGLNPLLLGRFYPLTRDENANWIADLTEPEVTAPLTQASMEIAQNWQSPFEGAGIESSFPALAQMSQSGMFAGVLHAIGENLQGQAREAVGALRNQAEKLVGRSGVTKLNSTQVWSGAQPLKIQITALFKAYRDPKAEVEMPIRQLQEWAAPQELAKDGVAAEFIREKKLLTLMPSLVPKCIGFIYKNRIFSPMVIESISDPLDAPIDSNGNRIHASIQLTLCSLTAVDRKDWTNTYRSL